MVMGADCSVKTWRFSGVQPQDGDAEQERQYTQNGAVQSGFASLPRLALPSVGKQHMQARSLLIG